MSSELVPHRIQAIRPTLTITRTVKGAAISTLIAETTLAVVDRWNGRSLSTVSYPRSPSHRDRQASSSHSRHRSASNPRSLSGKDTRGRQASRTDPATMLIAQVPQGKAIPRHGEEGILKPCLAPHRAVNPLCGATVHYRTYRLRYMSTGVSGGIGLMHEPKLARIQKNFWERKKHFRSTQKFRCRFLPSCKSFRTSHMLTA